MNNGYRWLSNNEIEIISDDNIKIKKIADGINVEKMLLWENIIEILEARLLPLEVDIKCCESACGITGKLAKIQTIVTSGLFILDLICTGLPIFNVMFKISLALLIYYGGMNLLNKYQFKTIKREMDALKELKNKYEIELEKTKNVNKQRFNSNIKSINVVNLEEYNNMFYKILDKQVKSTMEKTKVKKLTLKNCK